MKTTLIILGTILLPVLSFSQFITQYPEIPRIDVHTHVHNNYNGISNYLALRDKLLKDHRIDIAMWINLGGDAAIDSVNTASGGRIMTSISDYAPHRGLTYKSEDIAKSLDKGHIGYKLWHGPYQRVLKKTGGVGIKYFDDPAHEPVLSAMEKVGFPGASVHIADPNGPFGDRGKWAADPVEFWRQIIGLERVLQRHPDLVLVVAHGAWLVCQDAQLDFLRYLFSTYPNFYVDLSATFQYFYLVNHDNLRDLIIEYSDRILYGTDIGTVQDTAISDFVQRYNRTFRILETDQMVEGGFFGMNPVRGLDLPKEVLEKIYFKNAARIYPGLADRMNALGYGKSFSRN
jgi:hypothetical protein